MAADASGGGNTYITVNAPSGSGDDIYFGTRRVPYSVDVTKNPLSFKHIQNGGALPSEKADALHLPLQVASNSSRFGTQFTVTIEAKLGVTTGVSAADRATTI